MGGILIDKVMVLEWLVHYRICFFFKSDAYALTVKCLNEWIFAGRGQEMRQKMDLSLWRCQLIPALVFLLGFRWLPLGFLEKNSAFWMPNSSEKGKNWKYWELLKAWGSCHAWALGNLSLHLSLHPWWSPGARQLQLLSKEVGCRGQVSISVLQLLAQVHRQWLVPQPVLSSQTRTAVVKSLNQHEIRGSQLCSDCRNVTSLLNEVNFFLLLKLGFSFFLPLKCIFLFKVWMFPFMLLLLFFFFSSRYSLGYPCNGYLVIQGEKYI